MPTCLMAATLSISEETVEAHLRNIFTKLEVNDRTAAAYVGLTDVATGLLNDSQNHSTSERPGLANFSKTEGISVP